MIKVVLCIISFPIYSQIFASNSLGMPLYEIVSSAAVEYTYILTVEEDDDIQYSTLFMNDTILFELIEDLGDPVKSSLIKITGSKRESTFYEDGRLVREFIEEDGEVVSSSKHTYDGQKRLLTIEDTGNGILEKKYVYDRAGRLLHVQIQEQDLPESFVFYRYQDSSLKQYVHISGDNISLVHFEDAEETLEEHYSENQLQVQVRMLYQNGLIVRSEWNVPLKLYTEKTYQDDLLIEEHVQDKDGHTLSKSLYVYDDSRRLVSYIRLTERSRETTVYTYKDDDLHTVTLLRNRQRVFFREYLSELEYFETLYRLNSPFLKTHYRDNEKISEIYIEENN